jgi:hypothetical protein
MLESKFQYRIVKKLNALFPGCLILKNDPTHIQGIPDLIVLWKRNWAGLEVKPSLNAAIQPNQSFYIEKMDDMSFAAYICPENEDEVLNDLQRAFGSGRKARISKSK